MDDVLLGVVAGLVALPLVLGAQVWMAAKAGLVKVGRVKPWPRLARWVEGTTR